MMDLWHFACDHGHAGLLNDPVLRSTRDLADLPDEDFTWKFPAWFVWMTDLPTPEAIELGLTRNHIRCDRMQHRWKVTDDSTVIPWETAVERHNLTSVRMLLEGLAGTRPDHWFVSIEPVPAVYDPIPVVVPPDPLEVVSAIVAANWTGAR